MPRDRFLIGILVGIGALMLLALVLFFVREGRLDYGEDTNPAGALQNYLLALQKRDYERAYGYLTDNPGKPDFVRFRETFLTYQGDEITSIPVEVGETIIDESGKSAVVSLTLLRGGRDLFSDVYRDNQTASLVLQPDGWKVTNAPYPYWGYEWPYQTQPGPVP